MTCMDEKNQKVASGHKKITVIIEERCVWSFIACMILCGLVRFSIVYNANVFPCKVSSGLVWLCTVLYGLTQLCTIFVLVYPHWQNLYFPVSHFFETLKIHDSFQFPSITCPQYPTSHYSSSSRNIP